MWPEDLKKNLVLGCFGTVAYPGFDIYAAEALPKAWNIESSRRVVTNERLPVLSLAGLFGWVVRCDSRVGCKCLQHVCTFVCTCLHWVYSCVGTVWSLKCSVVCCQTAEHEWRYDESSKGSCLAQRSVERSTGSALLWFGFVMVQLWLSNIYIIPMNLQEIWTPYHDEPSWSRGLKDRLLTYGLSSPKIASPF